MPAKGETSVRFKKTLLGTGGLFKPVMLAALLAGGLFSVVTPPSRGTESEDVIRVEEDWELVLNEPDTDCESPQFHTVMSPYSAENALYAQVLWNYREYQEDYLPGGLQIQSWNGDTKLKARNVEYGLLSIYQEAVVWTQSLETNGLLLSFAIENGQSTTWGEFGKDLSLSTAAIVRNLNSYKPDYSVQNSWVTYGANRITSLKVTEVRYYGVSGLIALDPTDRVVYEDNES